MALLSELDASTHVSMGGSALALNSLGTAAEVSSTPLWDSICEEFSDVFGEPGLPAERSIKHRIDLVPGSVPPAQRQYRLSPAELAEVRR